MNPRIRTIAAVLGAVVLAGAAGIGVAAGGDSAGGSGTASSMTRPGPGGGFDLSALAEDLGVSESKLQDAFEAVRTSAGSQDGGPPDRAQLAQALADELGLPVDEVEAALEATMPFGGRGGPPADSSGSGVPAPPDGSSGSGVPAPPDGSSRSGSSSTDSAWS
jgi:hypothetical protein